MADNLVQTIHDAVSSSVKKSQDVKKMQMTREEQEDQETQEREEQKQEKQYNESDLIGNISFITRENNNISQTAPLNESNTEGEGNKTCQCGDHNKTRTSGNDNTTTRISAQRNILFRILEIFFS